jgi:NAD(P)H-dependent FMN reductase
MIHANKSEATILVIMGSIRAGRHCATIAAWVMETARSCSDLTYELVDLKDWPLPMDDEPGIPALGAYAQPHTQAWSDKVAAAAGFVLVSPQYNWGYPAVLKNALDHLYKEWAGKPVIIVTYGGHGGNKCAAQLQQVSEGLHMRPVPTMPQITLSRFMIEGGPIAPADDFGAHRASIEAAVAELQAML